MNYIEIEHLTKDFIPPLSFRKLLRLDFRHRRPTRALKDVSFSVKPGQVLGVLGPNGAGKTTLLKIISTLILPDMGKVKVKGYYLSSDDQKIKSLIGLVSSQERSFYWRLNGRQNLEFFATMYGLNKDVARARIEELFATFHIDYQDKRFDSYSTGMKQKFALIRALLNNPELLLFDEPTKSLDYNSAQELRRFIKLLASKNRTIIFATHNMQEAQELCDTFIILHKGRIFGWGGLEELRERIDAPSADLAKIYLNLTENA